MLVSGIIATAGLSGVLILFLVACTVLTVIDKKVDAGRIH
jgi:hypothetical protein